MDWIHIKVLIADKIKAYLLIFPPSCRKLAISLYKIVLILRSVFSFNICFAKNII